MKNSGLCAAWPQYAAQKGAGSAAKRTVEGTQGLFTESKLRVCQGAGRAFLQLDVEALEMNSSKP